VPSGDRFIFVMKPFLQDARRNVEAINSMAAALESELRLLFLYYGESTEEMKAEDFFRNDPVVFHVPPEICSRGI